MNSDEYRISDVKVRFFHYFCDMKKFIVSLVVLFAALVAEAQSQSFLVGKWTEIRNAIIKNLYTSYVDSLPVDRIEKAAVDAMLKELDPYTIYVPEEENLDFQLMVNRTYGGIGAIIYKPEVDGPVIINEPYENSPAHKNGIECGDQVLQINDTPAVGLSVSDASSRMKGEPGTEVVLKLKKGRSGEVRDVRVRREQIHIPSVSYYGMADDHTGYISLTGFTEGAYQEMKTAVLALKKHPGMQKLVLDLRGNGGGLFGEAIDIISLFVPKGSPAVSSKGDTEQKFQTRYAPVDTKIPMIVLVNSESASASEIVSGALQDLDRATIMGERTFGKGLVQSVLPLPYGGQLKLTTAKYYTPSGRCVQAIDYSRRNADGSVGHIPDSLTHEFRTSRGRIVRDGGGITPDVILDTTVYSRIVYAIVGYGIADRYSIKYYLEHPSIPQPADFHLSDADYEDFIQYALTQKFDCRSAAKSYYDKMVAEMRKDGLDAESDELLKSLDNVLDMDKELFLRLKKDELIPFIEEEIVVRYYFQSAAYPIRIRYDQQLKQALASPLAV